MFDDEDILLDGEIYNDLVPTATLSSAGYITGSQTLISGIDDYYVFHIWLLAMIFGAIVASSFLRGIKHD